MVLLLKKNVFLFLAIFLFVLVWVWFFFFPSPEPVFSNGLNVPIKGCVDLDRSSYKIPPAVFESLPAAPKCFWSLVKRYQNKQFLDDSFFTPSFFLQPEFYPTFESQGLSYWLSPNATHWGAVGYGYFPSNKVLKGKQEETIHVRFFFHSGFGVRTFQGLRLEPFFENEVDQNKVVVTLDSESQNGFWLGPSFPKFDSHWAKAVDVTILILPSALPGDVSFSLKTKPPFPDGAQAWSTLFGKSYYNATDFVGEQSIMRVDLKIEP